MELIDLIDDVVSSKDVAGVFKIRVPKQVATINLCGCIAFHIDDTMPFIMPTEEQRKNLKDLFCIEVIPCEDN